MTGHCWRKRNDSAAIFTLVFVLFILIAGFASASGLPSAEIWYLGHCGYAVKTAKHLIIFDYIELEENPIERGLDKGFVNPAEIADLDVIVFTTHSHIDHYDPIIRSWRETIPKIQYVFGWKVEEEPGVYSMDKLRDRLELDGVLIYTVNSHHSGVPEVAYLVQLDGLTLFHEGDYQGRMSRNEPPNVKEDMAYLRELVDRVDLVFVGNWTGEPILDILRGLEPKAIFPMHDRKKEHLYKNFPRELAERGFEQPVFCPEARGDKFVLQKNTVRPD
jgi:L-ascorbate metabolism protein UlaG (beta-lactamase superfamily)